MYQYREYVCKKTDNAGTQSSIERGISTGQ